VNIINKKILLGIVILIMGVLTIKGGLAL